MRGLKRVANRRNDALAQTHWAEVERLLVAYYRHAGYSVEHCGTAGDGRRFDGGVDLKLRRDNEYIVVQCKHWNAMKVTHNAVHQLLGIMINEGATGAIVVTSGEFTRAAIEAATRQGRVQLVDGDDLREMLGPLPEPPQSRWSLMSSEIGERLLDAAEDRVRGEVGRRGRVLGGGAIKVAAIKLAVSAVGLAFVCLVALVVYNYVIETIKGIAPGQASPASTQAAQGLQARPAIGVDGPSSTAPPVRHEPTQEEIRESQRKADEAIKVLEATTPEV